MAVLYSRTDRSTSCATSSTPSESRNEIFYIESTSACFHGLLVQSNRPLELLCNTVHAERKHQCQILHLPHVCSFFVGPIKKIYRLLISCAIRFTPDENKTTRLSNREAGTCAILKWHHRHVRLLILTKRFISSHSSVSLRSLSLIIRPVGRPKLPRHQIVVHRHLFCFQTGH